MLFLEVGAADEADGDFVAERGEELQHFGGDALVGVSRVGFCAEAD